MKVKLTIFFFLCSFIQLGAQNNSSISFNCLDEDSNAISDFYSRIISGNDSTPFILNKVGYSFDKPGNYIIVVRRFGYFEKRETLSLIANSFSQFNLVLIENAIEQPGVITKATRVDKNNAFAYTNLNAKDLRMQNLGQDFTYLLANTPSAVTTSDAGAGVGYTGIRIRGSDATRINVTINGIPINDAESHGVYWVNMPDLASSSNSVQVQRGVGTSTNGNGSFGANISINNIENNAQPFIQMQQSYGSFNTSKSNLKFGTGKIGNFSFNGRLSKIVSDGYIDRANSNLSAFQFNLNYYKNNWAVNAVSFGGKEKTYQSWNGTPQSRYENNAQGMKDFSARNYLTPLQESNLLNSSRTYNYYTYKNQTDNYWQNHYQLHLSKQFKPSLLFRTSFFTTTGKGYYEEYKEGASFANYGVKNFISPKNDTITGTNLVRQKWLDNIYYGNFSTIEFSKKKMKTTAGLGVTTYRGKHYGKVIWAEVAQPFGLDSNYYYATSLKNEVNGFLKAEYKITDNLKLIEELQLRKIHYESSGKSPDLAKVNFKQNYTFFNPKIGLNYQMNKNNQIYSSFSTGNREPIRSDFTDNPDSTLPKPEQLQDLELGWINKGKTHFFQVNAYYMNYKNQLVLTGAVNDVGTPLRKNVSASYRQGIELIGMRSIMNKKLVLEGNLTLSQNKIKIFEDVYNNYFTAYPTTITRRIYNNTDISFSPNVIGYFGITDRHIKNMQLGVNMKYVGKQYLDNTQNEGQMLSSYSTINITFQKEFRIKNVSSFVIRGLVNNLFSINYTNNGYTYKYTYDGQLTTENFYYPQSKISFLVGLDIKL